MDKQTREIAERFAILHRMEALEKDLLSIPGVAYDERADGIEFDIRGFSDGIYQVILIPKYSIPVTADDYYTRRNAMIQHIRLTCMNHGLTYSGDRIEDYGEHLYIVRNCATYWYNTETEETA